MNIKEHKNFKIKAKKKSVKIDSDPIIMGILNITPDSFSDGGLHQGTYSALEHARKMLLEGANIIDIGGESTRPEAVSINSQSELDRVMPIIEILSEHEPKVLISVDTYKAEVANRAILKGASIINDVGGLQRDLEIADVVARHNAATIIMHWDKSRDRTKDIISELKRFFKKSLMIAKDAGIKDNKIILDPGFGFAKTFKENYEVLNRLDELQSLNYPILVGTSNKSMIGKLLDAPIDQRLSGTIASNIIAYNKGAHIFRVHNVKENLAALKVAKATIYGV